MYIFLMTLIFVYALVSVVVVSLLSLIGAVALTLRDSVLKNTIFVLVSLSVGALFGDAFFHLIPEAFRTGGSEQSMAMFVLSGILLFFVLEKFLVWRHRHGADEESYESEAAHGHLIKPLGGVVLIGDALHNFLDGVIIGASYLVNVPVGIATTIAVILHEIPQEIGDFGVLIHAGYSRTKALWFNFLSALVSIAGLVAVFLLGDEVMVFIPAALAFAAGGFIYIAGSDLVPEVHKTTDPRKSLVQMLCILLGICLMLLLLLVE